MSRAAPRRGAEQQREGRWRRSAIELALAAAITVGMMLSCFADPAETTLDAAVPDPDYAAGKQALERKDWPQAVQRFGQAALHDPDNADLHNYLGFSYRKLGELDSALQHYRRALELNPRHRGAHEYAGEAYLLLGDLAGAEDHLAALRKICLLPCEELDDLDRAITEYRRRTGAVRSP